MMHFIFDLDDTLIQTQAAYNQINLETATLSYGLLGKNVSVMDIMSFVEDINIQNSSTYGFLKERFPSSWVQGVQILAQCYSVTFTEEEKRWIYESAYRVYDTLLPVYEDTVDALNRIQKLGHPMHIMTAGEPVIQEKRLIDANLRDYFDEVHVVPTKNPDIFRTVIGRRDVTRCVMIGNSLKSDIYPALDINMYAIHLKRPTWAYDWYEIDETNPKYFSVLTLSEAAAILEQDITK